MNTFRKQKAFTILELLVVVAIIAILAVIAIPNFIGRLEEAKDSRELAEIDAVTKAVSTYYADFGNYPTLQGKDGTLLQPQPVLGSPHNIDFSSLVPDYLSTLPHFSYWWVDYLGKVYHTENALGSVTANVFTPNSEFTYELHKADGSVVPVAATYTLQANEYIVPKDEDNNLMPVLSGVFKNAKEHPEAGIPVVASSIRQIVAGYYGTFALMSDGSVLAWGANGNAQLGDNTLVEKKLPVYVKNVAGTGNLTGVKEIAAGYYHTLALLDDGSVVAWGTNNHGQLGNTTGTTRRLPFYVKNATNNGNLTGVKAIRAGEYHSLALMNDGSVLGWGYNGRGQLGNNKYRDEYTPGYVLNIEGTANLTGVKELCAGGNHTVALMEDGSVLAWGNNEYGQLGDNSRTYKYIPVAVKNSAGTGSLTGVKEISAGLNHTVALMKDTTVMAWGQSAYGQLGDNTTNDRHTPVYVKNSTNTAKLTGVKKISVATNHTVALMDNGSVMAWGDNNTFQLGNTTVVNESHLPVYVLNSAGSGNLTGVTSISARERQTFVLKADGTVMSWGWNTYGQLGDNTTVNKSLPVYVRNSDNTDNLK